MSRYQGDGLAVILFTLAFALTSIAAYITHVVWAIMKLGGDNGATVGQIVLAGIGAFMPPIGVIHGVMIWFGVGF
jgi:hypothetical protein